jgi:phospholipid/cholesterol/gamma-HCH transport system substrate-binding protein
MSRLRALGVRRVLALAAVLSLVVIATSAFRGGQHTATVYFTETKGLYVGDDVNVLGVPIGKVTAIVPEPDRVRVELSYDSDRMVPADVKAVITAPSLVPVRNVTFTPVYSGGPALADGAVIPISRTAVPVEWDEIKGEMDQLAEVLGPKGANRDGSLSRFVNTAARNLDGRGTDINRTVKALSEAMSTLADNRGEVFGTVRNLVVFVDALRRADAQVADFNQRLSLVADLLDSNSGELRRAVDGMDHAFGQVQTFLQHNRRALGSTVKDLQPVARMLAENRQALADVLHIAPHLMSNLYSIYDPVDGSLAASQATANLQAPAVFICTALLELGGKPQDCIDAFGPVAGMLASPPPPVGASPVERNGRSNQVTARPGPEPTPGGAR